jgi:hypothetical protein
MARERQVLATCLLGDREKDVARRELVEFDQIHPSRLSS